MADNEKREHVDDQGKVRPRRSDHLEMISAQSGAHEDLSPEEDVATPAGLTSPPSPEQHRPQEANRSHEANRPQEEKR